MESEHYQIERDVRVLVARPIVAECAAGHVADLVNELCGRIDAGEADSVVIELGNVQHMDSACISRLLVLRAKARSDGGSVALSRCQSNVEFLFQMTRLDKAFGLFTTTESAVAELRERRDRKAESPATTAAPDEAPGPHARPARKRYTPFLNALVRAHRRKLAMAERARRRTA